MGGFPPTIYFDVINEVKPYLPKNFNTKNLGHADMILNIKLIKDENETPLLRSHYVEKVLS